MSFRHSSSPRTNAAASGPSQNFVYGWNDWKIDNEEDMWHLFFAITRTVQENELPMLDQFEFHDFVKVCQKFTSIPKPPKDLTIKEDTEDRQGMQGEARASDDEYEHGED